MQLSLSELKLLFLCEFICRDNKTLFDEKVIEGVGPLNFSSQNQISFLANEKYLDESFVTKAGFILCSKKLVNQILENNKNNPVLIVCDDPYAAFAKVSQKFFQPTHPFTGISEKAIIDKTAVIDPSATLFPFVFVGPGAVVGKNSVIYSGCFIGAASIIGEDCLLYPNVVVREGCVIGNRCLLNPGVVIGGDGFGFAPTPTENVKIPQIGNVILEDDVEVGSNSTLDRGSLSSTKIGKQTKIDNLVMIAHNVEIGEYCFIAGQTGIAGSSKIGNRVITAGQVGISGHVSVNDNIILSAQSGVSKNLVQSGLYMGSPAIPGGKHLKNRAILNKLIQKEIENKTAKE